MGRPNLFFRPAYAFKLRGARRNEGLDTLFYCGSRRQDDHHPGRALVRFPVDLARKNANSLSHEALLNSSSVQAVLEQACGSLDACLVVRWCRF